MNIFTTFMARSSGEDFIAVFALLYLVIIGVAIYINYLVAKKFESIAFTKGYTTEVHAFAMCFWLGMIGYIYVLALPNLIMMGQNKDMIDSLRSIKNDTAKIENKTENDQ